MANRTENSSMQYPLTFDQVHPRWPHLIEVFSHRIEALASIKLDTYQSLQEAVSRNLSENAIEFGRPIVDDEDAKSILNAVFEAEQRLIDNDQDFEWRQVYRRIGRHIRQGLSDRLLDEHLRYLDSVFAGGTELAVDLAQRLGWDNDPKSLRRLLKKAAIYRETQTFIHKAELPLSSVKVRSRAGARAKRGSLWAIDRREKFQYLEGLSDSFVVCPAFLEEDLEFLVSQSSLDMLKKKVELLLEEIGFVEPNRLKANYARLKEHLQRSKMRQSDYELRRQLLQKLGATDQQVDYISARATYQTMQNLLKLADGNLAISDLMGGKRTIRKLLRRRGKAHSQAERSIVNYLHEIEGVDKRVAENYARTRKNHSLQHLKQTVEFLKQNYRNFYRSHWGFSIRDHVLRCALELGLSRQKLSKRSLASKDFLSDLRRAVSIEETKAVKEQDFLPPDKRRSALAPIKEVLDYETDTDTRKQLYFIYELFCNFGLCIPKDKLKEFCLKNSNLFPTPRKVQDALEILNGAYRAVGQHGESLCILPDYINMPDNAKKTKPAFPSS